MVSIRQALIEYAKRKGISYSRVSQLYYAKKRLTLNEYGEIVPALARLEYEQMVLDREKKEPRKRRYSILKHPDTYKEFINNRKRDKFGRWVSIANTNTLNNTNNSKPGEEDEQ